MAVDGDTAVVGTFVFEGGVAHVFVRSGTTWTLQQTLLPSDAPVHIFGSTVAISGDTIVVGAFGADTPAGESAGAAYVFVRSGTTWTEQQKLVAPDGGPFDDFGLAIAVDGDRAAIGAFRADAPGAPGAGAAYVFARFGITWTLQQKVTAVDSAPVASFGSAIAIDGNTLLVGAQDSAGGGAAFVFVRPGTIWVQQQKLTASDAASGIFFGHSASLSGDTAVLGAFGGASHTGAAYAFVRSGSVWSEQQKLTASDGAAGDQLGWSVSLEGDALVVGAVTADTSAGGAAGAAYVFVRSGSVWSEQQKLTASNGAAGGEFGLAVSLSGSTVVVGAPGNLPAPPGAAYAFVGPGGAWTEQQQLVPPDSAAGDNFGIDVALDGDTLLVGAYSDNTTVGALAGSAYVFVRSGTAWAEQQKLTASDEAPGDAFGRSVSISGDTALVGANESAYVFVRSGGVWSEQQKLVPPPGGGLSDYFGAAVALSGDTAVVGARYTNGGAGAAYVFVRSGTTWSLQQQLPTAGGQAGASVALSGDTAVVGEPYSGYRVEVFVRSGTVWSLEQQVGPAGGSPTYLGESIAVSGDTLVVGTAGFTPYEPGLAYVFVRSGSTWSEQQQLQAWDSSVPADGFSRGLEVYGDTIVAGASEIGPVGAPGGVAYVFTRSGATWSPQQKIAAVDLGAGDGFGSSMALSADRVAVGAPWDDTAPGSNAGSAHVFRLVPAAAADLVVTKSDGQSTAPLGQPLTYAIVVSNDGPEEVFLAQLSDVLPAQLQGATWTCTPSPGASCEPGGTGGISSFVGLPVGGTATFSLTATVDPAASGTLLNTASVDVPAGFVDPDPLDNSASDTDQIVEAIDLSVQNTDGQSGAVPGQQLTYTIVVANAGPSDAVGATLSDAAPPALLGVHWSCSASLGSACAPGGSGGIADTVTVLAGGRATYLMTGSVDSAATGSIVNTASVTAPAGCWTPIRRTTSPRTRTRSCRRVPRTESCPTARRRHDLAAAAGPAADVDVFRIAQRAARLLRGRCSTAATGDLGAGSGRPGAARIRRVARCSRIVARGRGGQPQPALDERQRRSGGERARSRAERGMHDRLRRGRRLSLERPRDHGLHRALQQLGDPGHRPRGPEHRRHPGRGPGRPVLERERGAPRWTRGDDARRTADLRPGHVDGGSRIERIDNRGEHRPRRTARGQGRGRRAGDGLHLRDPAPAQTPLAGLHAVRGRG